MSKQTVSTYQKKIEQIQSYLFTEMKKGSACQWDTLSNLDYLAEMVCLSPHHWHRIYHTMTGETIAKSIRRIRLYHASMELLYTTKSLEHIAVNFGYASLASFSRAFTQSYQIPPNRYRQQGKYQDFNFSLAQKSTNSINIEIITPITIISLAEKKFVGMPHTGNYQYIAEKFESLSNLMHQYPQIKNSADFATWGMYFDDPMTMPMTDLESMACIHTDAELMTKIVAENQQLMLYTMPAGEYVVFTYRGAYSELARVYEWFYSNWLLTSGRELADDFTFERYLNEVKKVKPPDLLTQIHIPIKSLKV